MKTRKSTRPRFRHPADAAAGKQKRATAVFLDLQGLVHQKWEFLQQKGTCDNEILEALSTATGGEVARAAGTENGRVQSNQPAIGPGPTKRGRTVRS